MASPQDSDADGRLPPALRLVHVAIVVTLSVQVLYGAWQVFVVMRPPGTVGLLFGAAVNVDPAFLALRRLYAIETWLAFGSLGIYLGLTEILPRRLRR